MRSTACSVFFQRVERGQAEVALAARPEARTRRAHDVAFIQQAIKERPAVHACRNFQPDIRRIHPAKHGDPRCRQTLADNLGVAHVVGNRLLNLLLPFLGVHRRSSALHGIADAVELGGHAALPQRVHLHRLALGIQPLHRVRNDRVAAARARESRRLGEGIALDGALLRAVNLVDRQRNIRRGHERAVCRIVDNQRAVLAGVVHPLRQLLAVQHRAGRIVGVAEINHIHRLVRQRGHEAVFGVAGQVDQPIPLAVSILASAARHGVGIDIHRVHRVSDGNHRVGAEQLLNVAHVALRAVGNEHLVVVQLHAAAGIIMLADGVDEEVIAVIRAIAAERLLHAHFADRLVHRVDDGGCQRAGESPMPRRMMSASGCAALYAFTRRAISANR